MKSPPGQMPSLLSPWMIVQIFVVFSCVVGLANNFILMNGDDNDEGDDDDSDGSDAPPNNHYYDIPLDSDDHYHMYWDVDYRESKVTLEVHVRLRPLQWFALGFSDYGEITDADLCFLWWDRKRKTHFQDAWTDSLGITHVDEKQDCELTRFDVDGRVAKFMFNRKFDTCDNDDYIIEDGTTHVVFVTGKGPLRKLEGLQVQNYKFGFQRTQLLKFKGPLPKFPSDTRTFEIRADKVAVPNVETTYWCYLRKLPDLRTKHHIIQFEAVIQPGHESLVHHMEVFHCEFPSDQDDPPPYNAHCMAESKPPELEVCRKVIAAWAMGSPPLTYPEEVGLPFGGPGYSPYVMLEVHYNNPGLRSDYVDSSGVLFHYTSRVRKYDAAVIEVGLEYTPKMAIPPGQSAFQVSGHCTKECTEAALPSTGVVVFASQLHTHLTGVQVVTHHFRGGLEIPFLNFDNHYSPHFQEIRLLKNPVLLLPGDTLINTCTYKTLDRENITLGGYSISDEMCVNYMHYYPKTQLEVCKSSIDSDVLDNYFAFMNEYENQATESDKTVPENYRSISWTPLRSMLLDELYRQAPLSVQCNMSSGERFPGYWNNNAQLKLQLKSSEPKRQCDENDNEEDETRDDIV